MTAHTRDLGRPEHWHRSLERSRRRRALAVAGRKASSRRKGASLALTAAVAAGPTLPSVALAKAGGSTGDASVTPTLARDAKPRVLVGPGDSGPLVAQVQSALHINVDGNYGRQTEAAVASFQRQTGLPTTGRVDVGTFRALFPHGVASAPAAGAKQGGAVLTRASLSANGGSGAGGGQNTASAASAPRAPTGDDVGRAIAGALGFHVSAGSHANGGSAGASSDSSAGDVSRSVTQTAASDSSNASDDSTSGADAAGDSSSVGASRTTAANDGSHRSDGGSQDSASLSGASGSGADHGSSQSGAGQGASEPSRHEDRSGSGSDSTPANSNGTGSSRGSDNGSSGSSGSSGNSGSTPSSE